MLNKIISISIILICLNSLILTYSMANEKTRLGIIDFNYESAKEPQAASGHIVVDKITSELNKTGRFDILDKTKTGNIEEYDYKKIGAELNAQAIITGNIFYGEHTVTKYRTETQYNPAYLFLAVLWPPLLFCPQTVEKPYNVNVPSYSIAVKAIDVETGNVIASEDLQDSNLARLNQLSQKLYIALLKQYPIEGSILEIQDRQIFIDAGKNQGITAGDVFEVYSPLRIVMSEGVEIMRMPAEKVGEIEVITASETSSACRIIEHLTTSAINKGCRVKLIPLETYNLMAKFRRQKPSYTRAAGMGNAYIGRASGLDALKYNPAGLALNSKTLVNLSWTEHYNSSSLNVPGTGQTFGGRKFYGSYIDNPAYPSEFNALIPMETATYGLHVSVDDMHINQGSFKFDDGGVKIGFYSGFAVTPIITAGYGITWQDKWIAAHRLLNSSDYSYQFRGNCVGLDLGLLIQPAPKLSIGAVANLAKNYDGNLESTGSTNSKQSYSLPSSSFAGLGVSYRPWESLTLNLDLVNYFTPSWYDIRLGTEYALTQNLALRAGLYSKQIRLPNFGDDPNYPNYYNLKTRVYSAGLGYKWRGLFFDLAAEYEELKDPQVIVYPDFSAGSQLRTLLSAFKEARIKISIGSEF